MISGRGARRALLTIHLVFSLGWIGAALAYLALAIAAGTSGDPGSVRGAWSAMELTGWVVIVPLALGALATGLAVSLLSPWGLLRHYWVLISLVLTALSATVTVLHMPDVSSMAEMARAADDDELLLLGGDAFHPAAGLVVLVVITVLNVYKPRGRTGLTW
ncbi:DUF2269 domain-containing protein [Actinomycetospora rhizophila]